MIVESLCSLENPGMVDFLGIDFFSYGTNGDSLYTMMTPLLKSAKKWASQYILQGPAPIPKQGCAFPCNPIDLVTRSNIRVVLWCILTGCYDTESAIWDLRQNLLYGVSGTLTAFP